MTFKETIEALKKRSYVTLSGYPSCGELKAAREGWCRIRREGGIFDGKRYYLVRSDDFHRLNNKEK